MRRLTPEQFEHAWAAVTFWLLRIKDLHLKLDLATRRHQFERIWCHPNNVIRPDASDTTWDTLPKFGEEDGVWVVVTHPTLDVQQECEYLNAAIRQAIVEGTPPTLRASGAITA